MNDEQLLRYSRHIMLEGFDYAAQERLLASRALIIGMGGLGSPAAMYLASSGVGTLLLADYDAVELSNLQRQIAHGMADLDRPKVESVYDTVKSLNPDVTIEILNQKLEGPALKQAVAAVDIVLDCSDNFTTRFAINRACAEMKKPLVSGAAIRSEGQIIVFDSRQAESPCYRCLFDDASNEDLSCSENGVLAPLVGVIGSMQALEALKVLTGFGQSLTGQLLVFDAAMMEWRKLKVPKVSTCPVCG